MFPEEEGNTFTKVVTDKRPQLRVEYDNEGAKKIVEPEEIILDEFVEVMGVKAKGKKLSNHPVQLITWLDPIPVEEEEELETEEEPENENEMEGEENETEADVNDVDSDETDLPEEPELDVPDKIEESAEPILIKEPKEPKEPKKPKEPKTPKEPKPIKENKEPMLPKNPPDFPEDDDSGMGIQMSLF
jgi:hypothetical protein